MRAARIGVKVSFALHDVPDSPRPETSVKIVSDAELGGVLEDFARTGGIAVANVIMADFARRAAAEFARDDDPEEASAASPPLADQTLPEAKPPPAEPVPLAAHGLIWVVIKAYGLKLLRAIGLVR